MRHNVARFDHAIASLCRFASYCAKASQTPLISRSDVRKIRSQPNPRANWIMQRFLFPRWINPFLGILAIAAAAGAVFAGAMGGLITDPQTINVGYQPEQPVPFSHAIHAGQLKMDCRYCHNTVFDAAHAAVPPTATCINCHSPANDQGLTALTAVHTESPKLAPIRESWNTGRGVAWKRVHNLPEFVYFNHAAHVNSGVSCKSCHGRIDQMEVVYQAKQLSMAWCIDCHRNPDEHLRPIDKVTKLDWDFDSPEEQEAFAKEHREKNHINPQVNCAVCHR